MGLPLKTKEGSSLPPFPAYQQNQVLHIPKLIKLFKIMYEEQP